MALVTRGKEEEPHGCRRLAERALASLGLATFTVPTAAYLSKGAEALNREEGQTTRIPVITPRESINWGTIDVLKVIACSWTAIRGEIGFALTVYGLITFIELYWVYTAPRK